MFARHADLIRKRVATLALALLVLGGGAQAAPHRMRVDAMEYPWSAIGRLNVGGRSWCTAVLVSERHILTAAHCLWNPDRNEWWPAGSAHFIAGYQGGEAILHSVVKSYIVADGSHADPPVTGILDSATDWVIAELEEPLGRNAGWLQVGATAHPGPPPVLGQLGYRAESAHALTLDYGCQIVKTLDDYRIILDDCDAAHGDSGGPVLAFLPDGPHLVGITVLQGVSPTRSVTFAVSIVVLGDLTHFPIAARAALQAGLGQSGGHPPAADSPAAGEPIKTLATLGNPAGAPATLGALATLLSKSAKQP